MILGTVSGRAFGCGPNEHSCGMTFGEMALLAKDLGFINAMGLDGGGSSSLDILGKEKIKTLNIPTGGADVPRGSERFISTGMFVFKK